MDDRAFGRALQGEMAFLTALAKKKFRVQPADADDIVQHTLLKAWEFRHRYVEEGNLRAWLVVIMTNHVHSDKRRAWRLTFIDDGAVLDAMRGGEMGGQFHSVYLRQVLSAMLELPLEQLDAVVQLARGWQYEEAAESTMVATGTMKSRVARGRQALREKVE